MSSPPTKMGAFAPFRRSERPSNAAWAWSAIRHRSSGARMLNRVESQHRRPGRETPSGGRVCFPASAAQLATRIEGEPGHSQDGNSVWESKPTLL